MSWHEEPDVPEVLHDLEVWNASKGTVLLPSGSVKARHVLVGGKLESAPGAAPAVFSYYYRIMFHLGPHMRVSEYFDAGKIGDVGALRTISGILSFNPLAAAGGAAASPEGYVFLGKQILAGLDAIKRAITVGGPKGEKLLATNSEIRVPKETHIHIHYDATYSAEDAAEAVACNPCPIPGDWGDARAHKLPKF